MKQTKRTTVPATVLNRRADDKEVLFAALEAFINLGESPVDLQWFGSNWPEFLPADLYEPTALDLSEANLSGPLVGWYKQQLRKVWERRDPAGVRLGMLLRFHNPDMNPMSDDLQRLAALDPTFDEDVRAWVAVFDEVYGPLIEEDPMGEFFGPKQPINYVLDWRAGRVGFDFPSDFQHAVHTLLRESWRARICEVCRKYFIASKPARMYCSTACFGENRRKGWRDNWVNKGKARRAERGVSTPRKSSKRGKK